MGVTITRSGEAGQISREVIEGERPHSVSIEVNSKGDAQIGVKVYFAEPAEMLDHGAEQISELYRRIATALTAMGVRVAGWPEAPAR